MRIVYLDDCGDFCEDVQPESMQGGTEGYRAGEKNPPDGSMGGERGIPEPRNPVNYLRGLSFEHAKRGNCGGAANMESVAKPIERYWDALPAPCKHIPDATIKERFQAINEELDELKHAALIHYRNLGKSVVRDDWRERDGAIRRHVAEEAADVVTAVTSMLEAMGIDEEERMEAQRRVNQRNMERGRL